MAEAFCLNPDCEKESWILTKRLDEYSDRGPTCPDCGTTRIRIQQEAMPQGGQASQPQQPQQPERGGHQHAQVPATPQGGQQGGGVPANPESVADGAEEFAVQAASALDQDAPLPQRKQGIKSAAETFAGLFNGYLEFQQRKEHTQRQRAQNVDVQPVEDKARCQNPECGATFTHIPENANYVVCAECGWEHEVVG